MSSLCWFMLLFRLAWSCAFLVRLYCSLSLCCFRSLVVFVQRICVRHTLLSICIEICVVFFCDAYVGVDTCVFSLVVFL